MTATTLTTGEKSNLQEHEDIIQHGLDTFVEVGNALSAIRDGRLYRAEYGTFEDYCQDRWGMDRQRAYQLIGSAKVVENVNNCLHAPPANEGQARVLGRIGPEEQPKVWTEVVESAPKDNEGNPQITAKHVAQVVDRYKPPARKKKPAKPNTLTYLCLDSVDVMWSAEELVGNFDGNFLRRLAAVLTHELNGKFAKGIDALQAEGLWKESLQILNEEIKMGMDDVAAFIDMTKTEMKASLKKASKRKPKQPAKCDLREQSTDQPAKQSRLGVKWFAQELVSTLDKGNFLRELFAELANILAPSREGLKLGEYRESMPTFELIKHLVIGIDMESENVSDGSGHHKDSAIKVREFSSALSKVLMQLDPQEGVKDGADKK